MKLTIVSSMILVASVCAQTLALADSSGKHLFCFSTVSKTSGSGDGSLWREEKEVLKLDNKTPMGDVLLSSENFEYFGVASTPDGKYTATLNVEDVNETSATLTVSLDGTKSDGTRFHTDTWTTSIFKDFPSDPGKETKRIFFLTDWLDNDALVDVTFDCFVGSKEALAGVRKLLDR